MKIISNCALCEEKSLHMVANQSYQQCINCGYSTTVKLKGKKETNEMYKTLPGDMKSWSKESNGYIWIPSMITLPFALLYPINVDEEMKWGLAEMIDIPKEEQKDYPDEKGGYYSKRFDTENPKMFDEFIYAMSELNEKAKENNNGKKSI